MVQYLQTISAEPTLPWLVSAVVFVGVFLLVAVVGLRFLSSPKPSDRNGRSGLAENPARAAFRREMLADSARPVRQPRTSGEPATTRSFDPRVLLRNIYRALSGLIVAILLAGAVYTYLAATPANELLLFTGVFSVLALITLLDVLNFDRKMKRRADPAAREDLIRAISDDLAAKVEAGLRGDAQIQWQIGTPEVYRIAEDDLARARGMLDDGASIDEICRALNVEYGSWSVAQQLAYQELIRAALENAR